MEGGEYCGRRNSCSCLIGLMGKSDAPHGFIKAASASVVSLQESITS